MYTVEEFDREKTKVLKYVLYKKRSENEIRQKFSKNIEENLLEDIIDYLKEAKYIDDKEYIRKTVNNFIALILPVDGICGPLHKSTKFPCL